MAAGEEDGSAVEPEQEPAAEEEQPRSFKDLVRLDGSRFCPGSGCPVPAALSRGAASCLPRAARVPRADTCGAPRAPVPGSGSSCGRELRALGPAAVGMAAPIAAPQPAAVAFELF